MRLLNFRADGELTTEFNDDATSPYAILSHTRGNNTEETSFEDLAQNAGKDKLGHWKIRFCGEEARQDGLQYFWIDTCCINKAKRADCGGGEHRRTTRPEDKAY